MPNLWPSLDDQRVLAQALFGDDGIRRITGWLDEELARTTDAGFAQSFSDHIELPGVNNSDYLHRIIRTKRGSLLGGVRFYGRDISRPFVDVIAHSFADLDQLRDCVAQEWSMFAPRALRLCTRPHRLGGPHAVLDSTVHVARCRNLRPPGTAVQLQPFERIEDALALVGNRYRRMSPELAQNVTAASDDELRDRHAYGLLHAVHTRDGLVGALAVAPGHLWWLTGQEITEEVIAFEHHGHGYAALAQAYWAAHLAPDPDELLIGTIDRLNPASRRTAETVGRPGVLELTFILLPCLTKI